MRSGFGARLLALRRALGEAAPVSPPCAASAGTVASPAPRAPPTTAVVLRKSRLLVGKLGTSVGARLGWTEQQGRLARVTTGGKVPGARRWRPGVTRPYLGASDGASPRGTPRRAPRHFLSPAPATRPHDFET